MINWKLRLQNKVILTAIVLQLISIIYQVLAAFEIVPRIEQPVVEAIAEAIIGFLVLIGVVTDPTTAGIADSLQAQLYDEPREE